MPRHGPVQHTTKSLDTNQSLVRKAASQAIDQQEPPAKKRRVQPASDINFNRGASRQHYHFEQPKTPYPCVNWKILDYGLIIQRSSGRVFELECCFCHGNVSCGTHPQVFSGVEGLQRHITQGHKETCMRKGFDLSLSKTPSVEWIVRNCVRHELTVEEVEMVRNDAYAVTKNRTTTELQQELMAAFPLANDAFR